MIQLFARPPAKLNVGLAFNFKTFEIMDKVIDNNFERVESALAKLINSMSTYNPSPALATDLVTADAELSHGLEQCQYALAIQLIDH